MNTPDAREQVIAPLAAQAAAINKRKRRPALLPPRTSQRSKVIKATAPAEARNKALHDQPGNGQPPQRYGTKVKKT